MRSGRIGVVHGRFQPFHLGHFDYVKMALRECEYLFIGIANPDPSLTLPHTSNLKRAEVISNPFTYYERAAMINSTLLNRGYAENQFQIVPFPINYPDLIKSYVPSDAIFFLTIYDAWGYAKRKALLDQGYSVKVLEEGSIELKVANGTTIRECMINRAMWAQFVPSEVNSYIVENNLIERRLLAVPENE